MRPRVRRRTLEPVSEEYNLTAMAEALAVLMADDLEVTVLTTDVLDWLALTGLTLRPDVGDASIAYNLAIGDGLDL